MAVKHFTIISNTLAYAGSVADVVFQRRTKGNTRCAVIGWDARGASKQFKLQNLALQFSIGPRQYVQGAGVIFGLFTPVAPGDGAVVGSGRPFFPGTKVLLPDGTSCGAMLINPGEEIRLRLQDLTAGSAELTNIELHCIEWSRDCLDAADAQASDNAWATINKGWGETLLYGVSQAYTTAAQNTLQLIPRGPNAQAFRRKELRGEALDANGAVQEADFENLLLQIYSQQQRWTGNAGCPARQIAGNGAAPIQGALEVDLVNEERDYIQVSNPTTAARTAYFAMVYEGRDQDAPLLTSSTAIS